MKLRNNTQRIRGRLSHIRELSLSLQATARKRDSSIRDLSLMRKVHGTPVTPNSDLVEHLTGKSMLVSWFRPDQLNLALSMGAWIMIDNGAFSFFRKGIVNPDWDKFYEWLAPIYKDINHFIIPDIIGGSELDNDILIYKSKAHDPDKKGVPVWHLHESLNRLKVLMNRFDYIAFGSSEKYWQVGSKVWKERMHEAMGVVCDDFGTPKVKIHMLRCLNKRVFPHYPFYSADSVTFGVNKHRYKNKENGIADYLKGLESPLSVSQYDFHGWGSK